MTMQAAGSETSAIDATTVFKPTLHHVQIKTTRLQEMKSWYMAVLGAEVQFEFELGAFLYNDAANHRIVLIQTPKISEIPDKWSRAGLEHTAFEYDDLAQLLSTHERLKQAGIEPFICLDHGLTTSFYYSDPDKNSVELQVDNFGDWAKSSAFFHSQGFLDDPIGPQVDPEQLKDALHAGLSEEEIHKRSRQGEYPPAVPGQLTIPL
jgi:catechol 2,3-dioxygenase-like lactoylglutathione lyase family enzyme